MSGTPEVGAVVVGGGIAGLAAALELQREISEVLVLDASDRPGGVMRTDHVSGYVVERGPATLQVKAPMLAALRERGLETALQRAQPASRHRFLLCGDQLVPLPLSPLGFVRTPLLTPAGKLRLLAEPLMRRRDASSESAAEFAGRRLGAQAAARLVAPFLTGVYAGDEAELGAEAVFGGLVELERRYGSIALGALLGWPARRRTRGLSGTYSATKGLGPFARAIAERLSEPPALGARVEGLRRDGASWRLEVVSSAGRTQLRAARVVLAVPADAAARLLHGVDARAAELLAQIDYAPIVVLPLGVARAEVRRAVEGFGFLVPRDAGRSLLGCLYLSRLFPGRAPEGHELLHCLLGGARWRGVVEEGDDALRARVLTDLDAILGLAGEPLALGIQRWPRAIPQPDRDHVRRVSELRARIGALPGLAAAGSWVAGVSVADSFASGQQAARALAPV